MAAIAQLNLVHLQDETEKRTGRVEFAGLGRIHAPAKPLRFLGCLIDPLAIRTYSDIALCLRFHEVWGQFCTFLWYFHRTGPDDAPDIGSLPSLPETRCGASRAAKCDEIHAVLWKLRFEERQRVDEEYRASAEFRADQFLASRIPVPLFERDITDCTDEELLIGACEYAGMLAAIRWITEARRVWGEAGIMDVADGPFSRKAESCVWEASDGAPSGDGAHDHEINSAHDAGQRPDV